MMLAALACAGGGQVRLFTDILGEIRPRLETAFGTRLRGVVLYGSRARGDAAEDSDLDLMVLLAGPIRLGQDIDTIVHALYPLQLEVDFAIHAMPADADEFAAQEFGVFRKAKAEGVCL
jgi:predicted nucleotidyltransferase